LQVNHPNEKKYFVDENSFYIAEKSKQTSMRIIKTPWKNELLELVSKSKKSIKITSPFVKENICNDLLNAKPAKTKLELITSFKLMNLYSGSLDLDGIEKIIQQNGIVSNYPKLHSKLYIFDDEKVIITSGNLTNGGLLNNYEYGIYSSDISLVSDAVADFDSILSNEKTGTVEQRHIETVRQILEKIPKSVPLKLPKYNFETPEEIEDVLEVPENSIASTLTGWKSDVFNCVNTIPNQIFTLYELNQFYGILKEKHPSNQHIPDKIRQQLQQLRDLGLIEFLGSGRYKKLWK
jgi:hypothetical protein